MGGAAFPNHNTPRLSHSEHSQLQSKIITLLKPFYRHILCPPEAPSKPDHGDLDLLVCHPLSTFTVDAIAVAIGAAAKTKVGVTTSYCVPLEPESDGTERFAQIDLHLVSDESLLQWESFSSSYGDMQQILGVLQRPLGLTANDKGLHVRVREIEKSNRRKAMVFLTKDIAKMLEFFGLDGEKYGRGFEGNEDVFSWCLGGRFWGERVVGDVLEGRMRDSRRENGEEGLGMHSGDRQRLRKRDMFRDFVERFVPAHEEMWKGKRDWSREEVLEDALRFFDVRGKYQELMEEFWASERERGLLEEIKSTIPEEGDRLGQVMKGFKRWVVWEDGKPVMRDEDQEISDRLKWLAQVKDEEKDTLLSWVKEKYEILRKREKERANRMKDERQALKT